MKHPKTTTCIDIYDTYVTIDGIRQSFSTAIKRFPWIKKYL